MNNLKIGVLTSGGDSSGMNPAIRSVTRTALHHNIPVFGIQRGYQGLIEDDIIELSSRSVSNIIKAGGTILQTSRSAAFHSQEGREQAYQNLKSRDINALIVIGGDGSFHGLDLFCQEHPDIQGIGMPGTIDNDLNGTDYTIGFDTAVNVALDAIDKIRDTATSHNRLFLIEVMGRHAGYLALYTGIAGGAEEILIPETITDLKQIALDLDSGRKKGKKSSIVIIAEGDEAGGAFHIKEELQTHIDWDIRVSILGHLQRGGSPTAADRILASRLGYYAVQSVLEGSSRIMVGIINDYPSITPLEETWASKKTINPTDLTISTILSE